MFVMLHDRSSAMPQRKQRSEGDKLLGLELNTALEGFSGSMSVGA